MKLTKRTRQAGFTVIELIISIGGLATVLLVFALLVALTRWCWVHSS